MRVTLTALVALSLSMPHLAAHASANWVADQAGGCKVVDEEFSPDHSVHWTGPCPGGVASGAGIAEFSAGGNPIRRVEGIFVKGAPDDGPIKITRYRDGAIVTVTDFTRTAGQIKDDVQKITFYRDGAVASEESGKWTGGKLNGACEIDRYTGGVKVKSIAGTCLNGTPQGVSKVRFYAPTAGHDLLFVGPYVNGRLEGHGESSQVLTEASTIPAEACLRPGDVTLHYVGDWKSNSMNGQGLIESHFCSQTPDGAVHHVTMTATGEWADSEQTGETLVEFTVDEGAPVQLKRIYDHGNVVSETLVGAAPAADAKPAHDDLLDHKTLCQKQPWICMNENSGAPFARGGGG